MKSAVAIDDWKLPIFERHLKRAGYSYEHGAGVTHYTLLLYVQTDDVAALYAVLRAANDEALKSRRH